MALTPGGKLRSGQGASRRVGSGWGVAEVLALSPPGANFFFFKPETPTNSAEQARWRLFLFRKQSVLAARRLLERKRAHLAARDF